MLEKLKAEIEEGWEDEEKELRDAFEKIDKDKSGTLELWEVLDHLDLKRNKFAKRVFACAEINHFARPKF